MADQNPNPHFQRDLATIVMIIKFILVTSLAVLAIVFGLKAVLILTPFFIGLILAQSARSLAKMTLGKKCLVRSRQVGVSIKRRSIVAFWLINLLLLLLTGFLIFVIVNQTNNAVRQLTHALTKTDFIQNLTHSISRLPEVFGIKMTRSVTDVFNNMMTTLQTKVTDTMPTVATALLTWLGNFVSSLPLLILGTIVTFMSGRYFLTDTKHLYKSCRRLVPQHLFVKRSFTLIQRLGYTLSRIMGGYFLLFWITLLESWIAFLIIKLPHPFIWAIVAAFVDVLPILGITATLIPIAVYLLVNGAIWQALFILAMIVVITLVRRLLEPIVLGQAMRLHPIVTVFSMVFGITIWGFSGIVLGPLLFVTLREIVSIYELRESIGHFFGDIINRTGFGK